MSHLKIDVHTHILPEHWPDLDEKFGYGGFLRLDHHQPCCAKMMIGDKAFREIDDRCWSAKRRLEDCDADQVAIQVLSTVPVMFSYWAKPADAHELSKILNDHIAGVVTAHPKRFVGLGTLPMQAPDRAIDELRRCREELGLAGVQIGSHVEKWNLDDPALFPVFEAAQDLGAAIFVHPWDMMGMDRMPKYWLPWLVGMPAETSLAICSMIFGGLFERLPKLRVCFAHGGGAFPWTIGRVQHGFNVRPDLCAANIDAPPADYLGRFFVDSLVHNADALRYLINLLGPSRVTLGSDYPFPLGETPPGALIESLEDFSGQLKAKLLTHNAAAFLDINLAAYCDQ